jgi:hypothetical protein
MRVRGWNVFFEAGKSSVKMKRLQNFLPIFLRADPARFQWVPDRKKPIAFSILEIT